MRKIKLWIMRILCGYLGFNRLFETDKHRKSVNIIKRKSVNNIKMTKLVGVTEWIPPLNMSVC